MGLFRPAELGRVDAVGHPVEGEADVALAELRLPPKRRGASSKSCPLTLTTTAWPDCRAPLRGDHFDARFAGGATAAAPPPPLPQPEREPARAAVASPPSGLQKCSLLLASRRNSTCPPPPASADMTPPNELAYRIGAAAAGRRAGGSCSNSG